MHTLVALFNRAAMKPLFLALVMVATSVMLAEDVVGNVARIDAGSRSLTLIARTGWAPGGSADKAVHVSANKLTEYFVNTKSTTKFVRIPLGQPDLRKSAANLGNATVITFEDLSVGDRVLVRGVPREQTKLLAETIVTDGPSYEVHHLHGSKGKYRQVLGFGVFTVSGTTVTYSEAGMPAHNFSIDCGVFLNGVKRYRPFPDWNTLNYGLRSPGDSMAVSGFYSAKVADQKRAHAMDGAEEAIRHPCTVALRERHARAAEEAMKQQKAAAEEAALQQATAEREQRAALAQREAEFRNGIILLLNAADEPEPFATIRGEFDLGGSDSRQWNSSFQLAGADKCRLLKTSATALSSPSAWTFACLFRVSQHDGYERMVKSVQSILSLSYLPDEKAANINQVFFADPSKPARRFFIAKLNAATIGLSVVAVRMAGAAPNQVSSDAFATVSKMLSTEPAVAEGTAKTTADSMQTAKSGSECQAYQTRGKERASQKEEVRRLGIELSGLQMSYQTVMQQALEADQRASISCSAGGGGLIGGINSMGCSAARLTSQQKRGEAQSLQLQINQKQAQITRFQAGLTAFAPSVPPAGCRADGSVIGDLPGASFKGAPSEASVHDVVEMIRAGNHAAMPPAQRVTMNGLAASGRTTMTVKNSTAYELSVFFDGPVLRKLTIMPGASQDVDLAPGIFHVAGRVTAAGVLPFYGEQTYVGSARYSVMFYIAP